MPVLPPRRGSLPSRPRSAAFGQAIVEFALILPVATLLVLLGLDFSRVMHDRLILLDAARAGAQTAAATPPPPTAGVEAAVVAEAPDLPIQGDASHVQVVYAGDGTAQVRVSYGFQAVTPLIAKTWGGGPLIISVSSSWPLARAGVLPTPLPTPSAQPTITPTVPPTSTALALPTSTATPTSTVNGSPTGTATATPTASATATPTSVPMATPTSQPGCTYSVSQSLTSGQGSYVVISVPAGTKAIIASFKAPSTRGAVQVYVYAGGSTFAGSPKPPLALPPPGGSIAGAIAANDTATIVVGAIPGVSVYTVYFYTTVDVVAPGNSVQQTIGCSP